MSTADHREQRHDSDAAGLDVRQVRACLARRARAERFAVLGRSQGSVVTRQNPAAATIHPKGCTYGGFSCGYWLVADGCDLYHPERHIVNDDRCPCGNTFEGAGTGVVISDHDDRPLPPELRGGIEDGD